MNSSLQAQWSIEVSYFVPPECKILDTATIMQWDPEKKIWDNDGVSDVAINIGKLFKILFIIKQRII